MKIKKVIDPTARGTIIDKDGRIIKGVVYYAKSQYVRSGRFSAILMSYRGACLGYSICLKRK